MSTASRSPNKKQWHTPLAYRQKICKCGDEEKRKRQNHSWNVLQPAGELEAKFQTFQELDQSRVSRQASLGEIRLRFSPGCLHPGV